MIITRRHNISVNLSMLFIWFIIYSFIGWVYETIYCSIEVGHMVRRGFLYGPICPIYGITIILMIILLEDRCKNIFTMFFFCALIASFVEYITSFWMEAVFGKRWWNYTDKFLNLNGRICLGSAILFGLCGIVIIRIIQPAVIQFINRHLGENTLRTICKLFFSILFFDVLLSFEKSLNIVHTTILK